ncbi:hypothetical protein [Rhodococcoides yunnanense]|uniref:hypothetical protein n=1 Tax=Rhodococcoides yunnanense TaxID=278209 RepID=UPI0009342F5A|nr:hypothetical protein [Rhodococcus yunnanensis]
MTSTSKSTRIRDVAVGTGGDLLKAAKILGTGTAGVSATLATRGYTLTRREIERRKVRRAAPARRSASRVSPRTRRLVVFGTLFGVAAGIAALAAKRRRVVEPPADAPPSLADYAQASTSSNGQSAAVHKA